ncbi:vesicular glutamate transporter 1, partial [Elysia marginata]
MLCFYVAFTSYYFFSIEHQEKGEFSWGESTRSSLLSAYFYGYLLLQVPGGWLAGKYGATRVISLAMSLSAICTLFVPLAARNSLPAFYALRVATGLFAGSVTPSFQALWGRWAPPRERTRLAGFAYSGGSALLWTLIWLIAVYDSPSSHPSISHQEREYITTSLQDKDEK